MAKRSPYETGELSDSIFLILLATLEPVHGYRIMQRIKESTQGTVEIGPATMYTTLKKLKGAGWIAEFADAAPEGTPFVIDLMPEQEDVEDKGGTMRLGAYPCKVVPGTRAARAYGEPVIYERHRHRFEVNNAYRDALVEGGLVISGLSPDERLVEMIELPDHPFFVASQGHPEFKSRPGKPHPLFAAFVEAANERKGA